MSFLARLFSRGGNATEADHLPESLAPREFLERREAGDPVLDVRTPEEYHRGHLRGARNVDVMDTDFVVRVERSGVDRNRPVYLYCRTGNRSRQAVRRLRERGFRQAIDVGGLEELIRAGAEVDS